MASIGPDRWLGWRSILTARLGLRGIDHEDFHSSPGCRLSYLSPILHFVPMKTRLCLARGWRSIVEWKHANSDGLRRHRKRSSRTTASRCFSRLYSP